MIDGTMPGKVSRNYPEQQACEAEDNGDEARVVNGKILRRHFRRLERLRRRRQTRIVGGVLRHLSDLSPSRMPISPNPPPPALLFILLLIKKNRGKKEY